MVKTTALSAWAMPVLYANIVMYSICFMMTQPVLPYLTKHLGVWVGYGTAIPVVQYRPYPTFHPKHQIPLTVFQSKNASLDNCQQPGSTSTCLHHQNHIHPIMLMWLMMNTQEQDLNPAPISPGASTAQFALFQSIFNGAQTIGGLLSGAWLDPSRHVQRLSQSQANNEAISLVARLMIGPHRSCNGSDGWEDNAVGLLRCIRPVLRDDGFGIQPDRPLPQQVGGLVPV